MTRRSSEDFQSNENILCNTTMLGTLSKPIDCTLRVNPNVNYRLQVIMMSPCRFTDCNKCTTVMGDVDGRGVCACVGDRSMRIL